MDNPVPGGPEYIARLEAKLKKLDKKAKSSEVSGKELISSMYEFKEIYIRNAFKNNIALTDQNDTESENVDVSYIERRIIPVQQINTDESKCLVENDWLAIKIEEQGNQQDTETTDTETTTVNDKS